jgi:Conserved TM helix
MNSIWQNMAQASPIDALMPRYEILAQVETSPPATPAFQALTFEAFWNDLVRFLPNLLAAIAILVVGWIVASIAAAITKGVLSRTNIDNRIAAWITGRSDGAEAPEVENWVSGAVYWIILIFTIVAFLQALQLTAVSAPLNNLLTQVLEFIPRLAGAGILLGIAWALATLTKLLVTRSLRALNLDRRLNQQVGDNTPASQFSLSDTIGNTLYWFIFLLFLPAILNALQLQGTLQPVQRLLDDILGILPNIFAAILIGAVGWFVAQIVRQVVTNLLAATGTDRLGTQLGLSPTRGQSLSGIIGTVVYVLVLIPTAIAALQALRIEAISAPAIAMLNQILTAIPRIFTAGLILFVAYFIGRFVADFITNILTSIGFDNIFNWLGLPSPRTRKRIIVPPASAPVSEDIPPPSTDETPLQSSTTRTPSEIVGIIVLVAIILLAIVPATEVLDFQGLTLIVTGILAIAGRILAGLVVFAIGLYLANLAFNLIVSSDTAQAKILGNAARIAIIALVSAMALQQMGIASDIVNLAFGLLLGAIAVAIALAFGLGGRDIAADQVKDWLASFKDKRN